MACNTDITNAEQTAIGGCPELDSEVTLYCPDGPVVYSTRLACVRDYLLSAGWTTDSQNGGDGTNGGNGDGEDGGDGTNGNGSGNDGGTTRVGMSTGTIAAAGIALWYLSRN